MEKREVKEICYKELLNDQIIGVERVLNQINKLKNQEDIIDQKIVEKDMVRSYFDLELALVGVCILLRKMSENLFIMIDEDTRRDINSIIHSNRFDYGENNVLFVYSKKGQEEVLLDNLLTFAKNTIEQ